jgi:fibronectin type 3 domain-containing protein
MGSFSIGKGGRSHFCFVDPIRECIIMDSRRRFRRTAGPSGRFEVMKRKESRPSIQLLFLAQVFLLVVAARAEVVVMVWDPNSDAGIAGYNVYRSESEGGVFARLNRDTVRATFYADATAQPGATYYYAVTAVNKAGAESDYSSKVKITVDPAAGSSLVARSVSSRTVQSGQKITLTANAWKPEAEDVTRAWKQIFGPEVLLTESEKSRVSLVAPEVKQETLIAFRLTMKDGAGNSVSDIYQITIRRK